MNLDGDLADAEVCGDLLVQAPGYDQSHDLPLTRRQNVETRAQLCDAFLILKPCTISCKTELDGVKQILIAEWFCQELDRTALHRLYRHRNVAMPGDEDDRQFTLGRRDLALEVEPALSGQPDVEHQAGRAGRPAGLEEFVHRAEQVDLKPDGSKQATKRLPDGRIVINDDDRRWLLCYFFIRHLSSSDSQRPDDSMLRCEASTKLLHHGIVAEGLISLYCKQGERATALGALQGPRSRTPNWHAEQTTSCCDRRR